MLLNDEPTIEDKLGRAWLADELAELVATCEPPYVLGIDGDWGSGKTSFLRMLAERLPHTSRKCSVVFFEAWRHQFEEQPAIALLHSIRDQFSLSRRAWNEAGKLAEVATYTGLRLLDDLAGSLLSLGGKQVSVVETARAEGERLERGSWSVPLTSEAFRSAFQEAIAALTGDDHGKLVVLIDDLDRCSDDAVVRLLEGLKLYLNADNCVFVIAADRRAVMRALQRKLFPAAEPGDEARQKRNASEYSDKLFQSVVALPLATDLAPLIEACWRSGSGPDAPPRVLAQRKALIELQDRLEFLPPNPRKVKRFLVELHNRIRIYEGRFDDAPDLGLACAIQALQTFLPDVYRVLVASPRFWQRVAAFARLGPGLDDPHPVFAGLQVPDVLPGAGPSADSVAGETFHDPGDVSVFWAARVVRKHADPANEELYRLLLGRSAPPSADDADESPDTAVVIGAGEES